MVDTSLQVIDAFIDGERVDAAALKSALADSFGRDYFVDVWLMREAMHQDRDAAPPVADVPAAAPARQPLRWLVAAAIGAGLIGGYAIGYKTTGLFQSAAAPPATTVVSTPVPPAEAFPAPAPTRVIQLDFHPGTTAGGN